VKIRSKNLGEQRWLCLCTIFSFAELREFRRWLNDTLPDSKLSSVVREGPGEVVTCEVRGGDLAAQTLLLMVWNDNK
jgi:hypothetical protein